MHKWSLLIVLAIAIVGTSSASGTTVPRLSVPERSPVVVAGTGFRAGERLVLVVRAPALRLERTVLADAAGRFRTEVPRLSLIGRLRCATGVTIVARAPGGRLHLWQARLPDCARAPLQPA